MKIQPRRAHGQSLAPVFRLAPLLLLLLWPQAHAGVAAVASPEQHGTETAVAVLNAGGNAVDAAVATAFVLAVTYPEAGNIGGGGFATLTRGNEARFLDFREMQRAFRAIGLKKRSGAILAISESSAATTVDERGRPSMAANSPNRVPGPRSSRVTSLPPTVKFTTRTRPRAIK
jgi:hypothetical protein